MTLATRNGQTRTRQQLGEMARRKGAKFERDVARYLRTWWETADRAVWTGYRTADRVRSDGGDQRGLPRGLVLSLKNQEVERIALWWRELQEMDAGEHGDRDPVRLLVVHNRGHADPAQAWCWLDMATLARLFGATVITPAWGRLEPPNPGDLVRMHLGAAVALLLAAGFGPECTESVN